MLTVSTFCTRISTPFIVVTPGILSCLDGYMNAALEETQEVVNGKVTNSYGDAFVRGNNSERASGDSMTLSLWSRACVCVLMSALACSFPTSFPTSFPSNRSSLHHQSAIKSGHAMQSLETA